MYPYSASVFLPFSRLGRSSDGNVVKSSCWTTNEATFSVGSAALFPARANGTHASNIIPDSTFIIVAPILKLFLTRDVLGVSRTQTAVATGCEVRCGRWMCASSPYRQLWHRIYSSRLQLDTRDGRPSVHSKQLPAD